MEVRRGGGSRKGGGRGAAAELVLTRHTGWANPATVLLVRISERVGGADGTMMNAIHFGTCDHTNSEGHLMTTIEKLRTLARELAGEAWDYDRQHLVAQAYVRREGAKTVMKQAEIIRREDAIFEDPSGVDDRGWI